MATAHKFGLLMDMPDHKLPGFYAQVIKALAAKAPLFDRDKELLIFSSADERLAAHPIMEQYRIPYELMALLLLPDSVKPRPVYTDYGFVSRSGNSYVYADEVYLFTLHAGQAGAEPAQAAEQLEEHLLASFVQGEEAVYVTDSPSDELARRIARAYRCEAVDFLIAD
ncbi:hypothetical protein [Paenibacillus piri]|uniref:Uncharacterized protein n=1 Tax=Paenibacillus piri TaxID=2547395 RepID=A0A4R5KP22_9BACL|nr:hypothetical protein [Paenibacillus piri]TDF96705.1 hypothetical protein E1757_16620 [Paenibacillus piri]